MQGPKRKIVLALSYEAVAVLATAPIFIFGFKESAGSSVVLSCVISAIALTWNMLFNSVFEWWERRQTRRERTLWRRCLHATGFEGGLALILIPVMAWWLQISWGDAFWLDAGLIVFFLVYSFLFHWGFDVIFGVPESARMPKD